MQDPQVEVRLGAPAAARRAGLLLAPLGRGRRRTHPVKRFSAFQVDWPWREQDEVGHGRIVARAVGAPAGPTGGPRDDSW